jgi:hypothetical protein
MAAAGDVTQRTSVGTTRVNSANYILGPFGKDSDLRRWGLELAKRGGKNAKKRAKVAVARKLAVLMHRLWVTGEVYEPIGSTRTDRTPMCTGPKRAPRRVRMEAWRSGCFALPWT